jgi:hypothetical protein
MKPLCSPLLALLIVAFVSACSTTESPTASSALTGTLKGRVLFGSDDRADLPLPPTTATVSVEGTTFSTTTDSSGRWTINNLPAGTYNLSFTAPGFAMRREIGFQFVGGGTAYVPPYISLWKQTTVTVSDLRAVIVDTSAGGLPQPSLHVAGTLNYPATNDGRNGILVIGQHDSLSINNHDGPVYTRYISPSSEGGSQSGAFETWIPLSELEGFVSGSTTRVLGYGWAPQSSYFDPELGLSYNPNFSTPATASFVMP